MESRMHRKVPVRFGWGEKPANRSKVYLSTLLRQPFIFEDIASKKADVLARRYGSAYGLKIGAYTDSYIEHVDDLKRLFNLTDFKYGQIQKVLIGAVDNDFTRKVMNDYFHSEEDLIYIDAGIEGVYIPESQVWTEGEREEHLLSGYSGQVVVGVKREGKVILPPIDMVYPLDTLDAIPPSHNCGLEPYQPQRMIANEMAAFQISAIVNELFSSNAIHVHCLNFNARTGACRPVFVDEVESEAK